MALTFSIPCTSKSDRKINKEHRESPYKQSFLAAIDQFGTLRSQILRIRERILCFHRPHTLINRAASKASRNGKTTDFVMISS